jgi:formylglycine-generating enzyme required for sulfatase activity
MRPFRALSSALAMTGLLILPGSASAREPVAVPPGDYTTTGLDDEPVHVALTIPLLVEPTVVTVGEFRRFVEATGHATATDTVAGGSWDDPGHPQTDLWPVVQISFGDAVAYASWRSREDALEPAYRHDGVRTVLDREASGWRLPTEAEWEWAARCGGRCVLPEDIAPLGPVGDAAPNDLGLRGMLDEVLEWCTDGYQAARPDSMVDPLGVDAAGRRVIRGIDLTGREWGAPQFRAPWLGFRLVRRADALPDLDVLLARDRVATIERRRTYRAIALTDSLVWADRDRREPVRRVGSTIGSLGAVSALLGWSLLIDENATDDMTELGATLLMSGAATIAVGGIVYLMAGPDLDRDDAREQAEALLLPRPSPGVRVSLGCLF